MAEALVHTEYYIYCTVCSRKIIIHEGEFSQSVKCPACGEHIEAVKED